MKKFIKKQFCKHEGQFYYKKVITNIFGKSQYLFYFICPKCKTVIKVKEKDIVKEIEGWKEFEAKMRFTYPLGADYMEYLKEKGSIQRIDIPRARFVTKVYEGEYAIEVINHFKRMCGIDRGIDIATIR